MKHKDLDGWGLHDGAVKGRKGREEEGEKKKKKKNREMIC